VALGILVAAFFINRAGHFYIAAWIAILVQSIAIFLLTFITGGLPVDVDFLNFLILPMLFTSVFFSERMILVMVCLYLGGCLSSILIPGIDVVQVLLGPGSFIAVSSGVTFLVFRHRNALEADREHELFEKVELYRTLFEGANDAIFLIGLDNVHIDANQKAADMLGYAAQDLIGMSISDVISPQDYKDALLVRNAIFSGKSVPLYERVFRKKGGQEFPVEINATLVLDRHGNPSFIQSIVRDITERKQAQLRIQRQLEQLKALREIDHMISSSLDLQLILENILTYVTTDSSGCAANILLLDESSSQLECYASRGFQGGRFECVPLGMDDCLAGQAASHARPARMFFSKGTLPPHCPRFEALVEQGFEVGFALPLVAKGTVKGVLEVLLRGRVEPSPEWFNFLETLSSEAAIAVDSAELFKNLQLSNIDLVRSYDATLEGWVKALELRDEETQGHSQRVTEMTVELGRALEIDEGQLVHLRRGALLHDIGKMGIPDAILLKPGPLTAEEWVIMKKHPVYALDMLSLIPFLQPVLDIPYAHHERWDGSGYPLGLKGNAIPQAARIFMVVDVWDALNSDRPYRPRWSEERTLAYIQEQAGKEFDPQVVEAFTRLISNSKP
jgi:PAS domain S-box-containing protein